MIDELNHTPEPKRSECLHLFDRLPFLDITEEADDFVETCIANKVMPATTVILKYFNTFAPDRLAWLCSIELSPPDFDAIARSHQILETEGVK